MGMLAGFAKGASEGFIDHSDKISANLEAEAKRSFQLRLEDLRNKRQIEGEDRANTRQIEAEARATKNAKELKQWEWDNKPTDTSWKDKEDYKHKLKLEQEREKAKLKGNDPDNKLKLETIKLGEDEFQVDVNTGRILDPFGQLTQPSISREQAKADIEAMIDDKDGWFGNEKKALKAINEEMNMQFKTLGEAKSFLIDQQVYQSTIAGSMNIPQGSIVKSFGSSKGDVPAAPTQGEKMTFSNGLSLTMPASAAPQQETSESMPVPTPEQQEAPSKKGIMPKRDELNDFLPAPPQQRSPYADSDVTGTIKQAYEDSAIVKPAIDTVSQQVVDSFNAYKGVIEKAVDKVKRAANRREELIQSAHNERALQAIEKIKNGEPLNKLEINSLRQQNVFEPELEQAVDAYLSKL